MTFSINSLIPKAILGLFDADLNTVKPFTLEASGTSRPTFEWDRYIPFVSMHAGCLLALWGGVSWSAVILAIALYWIRMFAITGFYHRYFSHRTFQTSRVMQFLFAILGLTSLQRGPLWWASHHRFHHQHVDTEKDLHSPRHFGFWWSHMGWMTVSTNLSTDYQRVPDFVKFPELVFLNRFDWVVPLLYFMALYGLGEALAFWLPELKANGIQFLAWGGFISTVALLHATLTINSLSHVFGSQRYKTGDDSRNNWFLAILTMGEGWHNNHHRYPGSVRQGFFWQEWDPTYYILLLMNKLGLVWDLHPVPVSLLQEGQLQANKPESRLGQKLKKPLASPHPQIAMSSS
jgi:stearoyl-CoA desaturase (delta-9 desaturase)